MNWSEHAKIQRKEIQKQIEELQAKLEELEKTKSPVEEAFKDWWGQYPETGTWDSFDDTRWQGFQAGYEFAFAISTAKEVMERVQEEQGIWNYDPDAKFRKQEEVKKLKDSVKNLEENNWYVDAKSLVNPPTLWERFYAAKWSDSACDEFCEIVEQWLNDNTTTVEEDYHTVTLKLKKGMLANSND